MADVGSAARGAAGLRALWDDTSAGVRESPGLRLVLFTTVLSSFIAGLLMPVLPLFLVDRGFSLLQLGGLFSLVAVATIAVQVLTTRAPRIFLDRRVVMGLQLVSVLAFPTYIFLDTPLQFLGVTAAGAFAGAASAPGLQVLIAQAAPITRRAAIFAHFGVLQSLTYALAVAVGFALSTRGFAWLFYLGTVASLLSLCVTAWVVLAARGGAARRSLGRAEEDAALRESARAMAGLRGWWGDLSRARAGLEALQPRPVQAGRNVRWLTVHLFFFGISLAVYPVYFPLYLTSLGLSAAWVGLVIAASWVTFAIAQPFGARFADATGRHRAIIVGTLLAAAALNFILATGPLPWVVAAWVLLGVADGMGRPVTSALVAGSVAGPGRASAYAWTGGGATAAQVVAPFALAFAVTSGGFSQALMLVSATILLAALPMAAVRVLEPRGAPARPLASQGGAA